MPHIQMSPAPLTNPSCHQEAYVCKISFQSQMSNVQHMKTSCHQDLMAVELVPDLIAAGVTCFKIEGRLKGPEYVALTTQVYRQVTTSHIFVHIYIYIYIYLYKYIYTHVYVYVYMFLCICIHVYIYISIYFVCIYIFCTTKFYRQVNTVHISVYICVFVYM